MTGSPIARALLLPFAFLYGAAMRARPALYRAGIFRSYRLPGTVISVGNLTVGGTGKTPMVLWMAERLASEGCRPAILTRGYGGFAQSESGDAGSDEVALLRQRLGDHADFGVGKDRYGKGLALASNGARWFILDDGYQHLRLRRDANILLLDATAPFGGGLLPAGRLREPKSALKRADIIVVTRSDGAPGIEAAIRKRTKVPIFYAQTKFEGLFSRMSSSKCSEAQMPADSRKLKYFAFCGIGNPQAFFSDLAAWGFEVAGRRAFRDHHRYSEAELAEVARSAASAGADALVCTEKDSFNLPAAFSLELPVYICRIRLALNDEEGFWNQLRQRIGQRQPVIMP